MLEVKEIHTYYGKSHIIFGISLSVQRGEVVCLLGRNGAGKTTTFRSIMNLASTKNGSIRFKGIEISGLSTYKIASMGIGFIPQGRRLFGDLTVRENLEVVKKRPVESEKDWTIDKLYELFPMLKQLDKRIAGSLSGGQQQMVTIARTLASNPELILLDEPSEGLGPLVVESLKGFIEVAKDEGIATLLAEQNVRFALGVSDRSYIIDKGQIIYEGDAKELEIDEATKKKYLAV